MSRLLTLIGVLVVVVALGTSSTVRSVGVDLVVAWAVGVAALLTIAVVVIALLALAELLDRLFGS